MRANDVNNRGAGINLDVMIKEKYLKAYFVVRSNDESKVLEHQWHYLNVAEMKNSFLYRCVRSTYDTICKFGSRVGSNRVVPQVSMATKLVLPGSFMLAVKRALFTSQSVFFMPLNAYYEVVNVADPTTSDIHKMRVSGIRDYFGEKIAYYFAFFEHYNSALLYLAGIGLLMQTCYIAESYEPNYPDTKPMRVYLFVFQVLLICWQSALLETWKIKQLLLACQWGTKGFNKIEDDRIEFRGGVVRVHMHTHMYTHTKRRRRGYRSNDIHIHTGTQNIHVRERLQT